MGKNQQGLSIPKGGRAVTGSDGFTLIEVLIALLVLSIGLLSVAAMQISSIKGNGEANHITEVTALMEKKLDGYKSMDYDTIVDEAGTEDIYDWVTTVKANEPVNDLKTITIDVTWFTGEKEHSLSFGTIIADD